ncbi:MAG: capsule biosynthesis protein CapA [Salinicola sp.]|uniref:capsular polysaccharide export protein, LipB/KpsS family n=1 Tax=uncultured Salinicola sp. TaxID=1193542 RepID=UPI000C8BF043|nr:capsule biosynthesis protein CapA [uncultured Salinicola sp.]MAM56325.1 capsule biosynthesis protein CapA [Salinicola sp.]
MFPARRAFLFLQGPGSPFLSQLGKRLTDDGHKVVKVNFTLGDQVAWQGRHAETFRDPWPMLAEFVTDLWRRHGITDQVAFDDNRPAHKEVVRAARRRGIRSHILAPGYFQPYWITLEREGTVGHSLLPRDPEWYHAIGPTLPRQLPPRPFETAFARCAARAFGYRMADLATPLLFRHDRGQAGFPAGIRHGRAIAPLSGLQRRRADSLQRTLIASGKPYYLFPLQPADDPRIRFHSPYADLRAGVSRVVESFARFAPGHTRLAIVDPACRADAACTRQLRDLAATTGLGERLVSIPAGNLPALIEHASGLITINGNEGLMALESECPTLALGEAIYRMPGLTAPSSLDDFWRHPIGPDRRLFGSFARTVIHATQVNGGFYSRPGIDLAVVNAVSHLTANVSPIERLLWDSRLPVAS